MTVDAEAIAGVGAAALAVLGARRRRRSADGHETFGQAFDQRAASVATGVATGLRWIGSTATVVTVGTGEVAITGTAVVVGGVASTAGRVATEVAATGAGVAVQVAAASGGLLIDGVLSLKDGLIAIGHRGAPDRGSDDEAA